MDEGLPQSSVTDIAQTPDGFLWVGTLLSGLSRFDGVSFVNYDTDNTPDLISPAIRRLQADSQGNLWISAVPDVLLLRKDGHFTKVASGFHIASLVSDHTNRMVFTTLEGQLAVGECDATNYWNWRLHAPPVSTGNTYFEEDRQGMLWFQAPGKKLGRFKDGNFEILEALPGLSGKRVQSMARDAAGTIWVGTDCELAYWTGTNFASCNPANEKQSLSVRRIVNGGAGRLWVEVDGKLQLYDNGIWHEPVKEWNGNDSPWSHVRSIRVDPQGGFWAWLGEDGLAHVAEDGKVSRVTSADGLPSQRVQAFYCGRDGNLWAGYHRGGLVEIRQETFHSVKQREGLVDTLVTSVTEDSAGAMWLGTSGGGLVRWEDGICQNFSLPLRGAFCTDITVGSSSDGQVWIGTVGNGLLVWRHGEFRHVIPPEQIPEGIRQIAVTPKGRVWFANFSGLYYLNNEKAVRALSTSDYDHAVTALAVLDEEVWVGTMGGHLRHYRDGQWDDFQPGNGMAKSRMWSLLPERDGTVWIGTFNAGLLRFKDGKFTRFTTVDGLVDNNISHILSDDASNLWLASRNGVMRVPKVALNQFDLKKQKLPCRVFGRNDGLPTLAFTLEFQPGCVRAHDGSLWFGTPKGATWVNPNQIRNVQPPPVISLESIIADGQQQGLSPDQTPSDFVLEAGNKTLKVDFTAPDYTAPDLLRFQYRLDPFDGEWVDLGNRRSISFNHLPPGQYRLQLRGINADGQQSNLDEGFNFVALPHLWERRSFFVTVIFALLAGVALTVRRVTQARLQRRLESLRQQQQIERERSRIAQDLHDDLGAGLTEISLTSDLATNPMLPEHESRQYTHEIGIRARELVQSMDEIVWAVNPRNDSINSLSIYACQYAQRLLKPLEISCRLDVQAGLPETPLNAEQRYNFFLAFKEAINNIARHSEATEMHLAIHAAGGQIVFQINDNGRGFEPAATEQAGADGLRNIRERMLRLGGHCEITTKTGQGTHVSLCVPLGAPSSGN